MEQVPCTTPEIQYAGVRRYPSRNDLKIEPDATVVESQ